MVDLGLNGYGIYVWPSYAATGFLMAVACIRTWWRYQTTFKRVRKGHHGT